MVKLLAYRLIHWHNWWWCAAAGAAAAPLYIKTQVAKLLVIPFVCAVEAAWLGRRFNMATLTSIVTVIVGVAVV